MDVDGIFECVNPLFQGRNFLQDFEVFALECTNVRGRIVGERRLLVTPAIITDYIAKDRERRDVIQILCSRHKDHLRREIRPSFPSLFPEQMKLLQQLFDIPKPYQEVRTYANGTGAFQRFVRRDDEGRPVKLSYILRAPHSPRLVKSIWSIAGTWDSRSNHTFCIFDGAADFDVDILAKCLQTTPHMWSHPLTIPTMLLELLGHYKTTTRNQLESILWELEVRIGVTRPAVRGKATGDIPQDLDLYTMESNRVMASIVYQERAYDFQSHLAQTLRAELRAHDFGVSSQGHDSPASFLRTATYLDEILFNRLELLKGALHQVQCLSKRTQSLLNVIYILIAQRDSQATVRLATAAKRDSSVMTAIAILTMIFLPATFISSFFGMNFFQYQTASETLITARDFWVYWAVTIPMTLVCLGCFAYWTFDQQSRLITPQPSLHLTDTLPSASAVANPRSAFILGRQSITEAMGPLYPLSGRPSMPV